MLCCAKLLQLGQEDPLEEGMATTPVFLPGEFHGQRSLAGYSPWVCKEWDTTERLSTRNRIVPQRGGGTKKEDLEKEAGREKAGHAKGWAKSIKGAPEKQWERKLRNASQRGWHLKRLLKGK